MVLLSKLIKKNSKIDDHYLIKVFRQKKEWSLQRLMEKFSWKQAQSGCWKINSTAWRNVQKAVTLRFQNLKKIALVEKFIRNHESVLYGYKTPYEI